MDVAGQQLKRAKIPIVYFYPDINCIFGALNLAALSQTFPCFQYMGKSMLTLLLCFV